MSMADLGASPVVAQLLRSATGRSRLYLAQTLDQALNAQATLPQGQTVLSLPPGSAIVGLQGAVNLWIVFSLEPRLLDRIYQLMTADFQVADDEVALYRDAAVAEMANTILGHCTADLQALDTLALPMTPPVVLAQAKQIAARPQAQLHSLRLDTNAGYLDLAVAGPAHLFNAHLDYLE